MSYLRQALLCAGWLCVNSPTAVLAQTGASTATHATVTTNPQASAATAVTAAPPGAVQKWGEGVLEIEFLNKLRAFLETDPFDFKGFEKAFGVPLQAEPPGGPHPDGSWGVGSVRYAEPFGRTFNNRNRGGIRWSFSSSRNTSYVAMEFVKMPPAGKREGDGLPCITMDHFAAVLDTPRWTNAYSILRYSDGIPVYGSKEYKTISDTGVTVRLSPNPGGGCSPYLYINFDRLPTHPGVARPIR